MIASSSGILSYHLTRLSIALKKAGHGVVVLSGPKEQASGLSKELTKAGIGHFTSYHIGRRTIQDIYGSKKDIERILKIKDIDVIHAQGATHTLEAFLAVESLHSNEKPSIVTTVHFIPKNNLLQKPRWVVITTILNICSDIILPVSNNTRELLVGHGLNPRKTVTVHNAIDLDVLDGRVLGTEMDFERERSDRVTIVYVANLIPRKGQEYYLMAAAEVLKNHPATFYIVGSGPQRKYLEELSYRLGIKKDVVFTGRIPWPEMYHLLSNVADICVSSSLNELFPFYILECMATRKPIVATNVGGVSEAVIDGVNGYLVPLKSPTSLAKAIMRLIEDPDEARQMGKKGRRLVERRFSMEVITSKLSDIYELALKK